MLKGMEFHYVMMIHVVQGHEDLIQLVYRLFFALNLIEAVQSKYHSRL